MQRRQAAALAAVAAAAFGAVQVSSAGTEHAAKKGGAITIESWLHATPSANSLSGTVKACFKLKGALVDQGGDPSWSSGTYADTTGAPAKCGDETPVGGFVFVPGSANTLATVYAVHTVTGRKGQIFITFSGVYNLGSAAAGGLAPMQGSGTWVITGGNGAYTWLSGEGSWSADASLLAQGSPYIRHTETGRVDWLR
jgi:hypothetical protein